MKKQVLFYAMFLALGLSACSKKEDSVYALSAEEKQRAGVNAQAYFRNAAWPVQEEGKDVNKTGIFNNCRPTDSNANGKVSCSGKTPAYKGGYQDVTMYCGYNGKIDGCSDKDD